MKKNGLTDNTIMPRLRVLKKLTKLCNITEPDQVKTTLCELKWSNGTKKTFAATYTGFLKFIKKEWNAPNYTSQQKLPFIPTETEIDQLIAAMSQKIATFLQTLKETGMRCGEATMLQWKDISFEQKKQSTSHPKKAATPESYQSATN